MGIEKGRPSEQSPKMKGIFYEAMQEKKLSESPKPLILLGFSKSSVSPFAPRAEDLRRRSSALFFERAKENPDIKIVVVWPGQYRSEAFLCDPTVALEKIR